MTFAFFYCILTFPATVVESRTKGSRPSTRTQKNLEAKDRPSRGQGPRKQAHVFCKKNKNKGLQNFFSGNLKTKKVLKIFSGEKSLQKFFFRQSPVEENKKGLRKFFARFLASSNKISTVQKIVLSSSRG